jgi:dTDP-4-amino-4,6-dideoxygalactose transaminase
MPESIPLAQPDLGERERELVLEALESGRISMGPRLDAFERAFAAWLGTDDAVALSSGTTALHLGVRAHGWADGDEVITSPFTFVATANALLYERAAPVFADIDPVTFNLDPGAVEATVNERTAGLLPVHIFGYPADMPALEGIASQRGLPILEDSAQALGAIDSEGRKVGARGNPAVFAFYANKQMATGEGGMLIPAGAEMATAARSERNQGRAPDMSVMEHDRLGFNYRMSEITAALGAAQLERLDRLLADRARVAELYGHALGELGGAPVGEGDPDGIVLACADRGQERRSWFVYPIQLPVGADRKAVIAELAEAGIQSKAYLPCVHLMPFYSERFGFRPGQFPVAEALSERSLALPFFGPMTEGQVERVSKALESALTAAHRSV